MAQYRVVWTKTVVDEEWIEAESIDDAESKWEELVDVNYGEHDAQLFFIEDEDGNQVIYN